jgi:hypothetical protein
MSVLTNVEIVECILACLQGIGCEIGEGTRKRLGPSCVALDLAFFWFNLSVHSQAMSKARQKAEINM